MERREFLILASLVPATALGVEAKKRVEDDDVGPVEDLMREHGVLRRILLVYDEAARRLRAGQKYDAEALKNAAHLVRDFVEDYHERDEEQFIFPRFEKAGKLPELVSTLRAQHQEGRRLTDSILQQNRLLASTNEPSGARRAASGEAPPSRLLVSIESFCRMYRAHAAREDTVLFVAFHKLVSRKELEQIGEKFEQLEHAGAVDFEKALERVAAIERAFDIADLAKYTPT